MRLSAFARMHVVQKEEKEARLKEFIERDIAARREAGEVCEGTVYRLLALSPESPVAIAVAALAPQAAAVGITIEAVFLRKSSAPAHALSNSCRYSSDARLLDAHEQLVLGQMTAWIGDCMRRDPAKRDAFECYSDTCAATAARARRSFDRIWSMAATGGRGKVPRQTASVHGQLPFDPATLLAGADAELNPIALRH